MSRYPATPALGHFEAAKDDPKVQALRYFIQFTLLKPLEHVNVWSIEPFHTGNGDARPFRVEMNDGMQIIGRLHREMVSPYAHAQHPVEKWSVGNDWTCVF